MNIINIIWVWNILWWNLLLRQNTCPATSDYLFWYLRIKYVTCTGIKLKHDESFCDVSTHYPAIINYGVVWTHPVWYYFPPWMLSQNTALWLRQKWMQARRLPKAFVSSAGILNLPITSLPVDNFKDRALWCKPTGINYNMHGWILCRYCATGWFWWISGLRAVTMWSSASFTKTIHGTERLLDILGAKIDIATWNTICYHKTSSISVDFFSFTFT